MKDLTVYNGETQVAYGRKTNKELLELEKPLMDLLKYNRVSNISLSLHTSMVWGFAKHLPYSMDIQQEEYVPGDFLNIEPADVEENKWFKWPDRRTFYNAMVKWGDTFKSGTLLQVCYIFQQMLLGNLPANYTLSEDDFYRLGIHKVTSDKEYNRNFFNVLQRLPEYYLNVVQSKSKEERRRQLEKMYEDVCVAIENRIGGFRETDSNGNIIRESKASIRWSPYRDIEMLVDQHCSTFYDGLKLDLTRYIKEMQLKNAFIEDQPGEEPKLL